MSLGAEVDPGCPILQEDAPRSRRRWMAEGGVSPDQGFFFWGILGPLFGSGVESLFLVIWLYGVVGRT